MHAWNVESLNLQDSRTIREQAEEESGQFGVPVWTVGDEIDVLDVQQVGKKRGKLELLGLPFLFRRQRFAGSYFDVNIARIGQLKEPWQTVAEQPDQAVAQIECADLQALNRSRLSRNSPQVRYAQRGEDRPAHLIGKVEVLLFGGANDKITRAFEKQRPVKDR